MNIPIIKVCGIRTLTDAEVSVRNGATTLGFLLGLTHEADDGVSPDEAREIIDEIPAHIDTWMVTHLRQARDVQRIALFLGVNGIQLHDDLDDGEILRLRAAMPAVTLVKTVHVQDETAIEKARQYATFDAIDALLLDSRTASRLGGTGIPHDWSVSRRIVSSCRKPVILAGGLGPHNVESAITHVQPAGIDANSGLEDASGAKEAGKVSAYARTAAALLG